MPRDRDLRRRHPHRHARPGEPRWPTRRPTPRPSRAARPASRTRRQRAGRRRDLDLHHRRATAALGLPLHDLAADRRARRRRRDHGQRARSSSGVKFRAETRRLHHRRALLQGRRATPAPTSATCGPAPARCWPTATFTGETAAGWQQVAFCQPGRRSPPTPPTSPPTTPPTGTTPRTAATSPPRPSTTPPLHALADGADGGNGVYRYGAERSFPTDTCQREQLLGRRRLRHRTSARTPRRRRSSGDLPPSGAAGVGRRRQRRGHLQRADDAATINDRHVELRDAGQHARAGRRHLRRRPPHRDARPRPATLADSTTYTATVKGGAPASRTSPATRWPPTHLVVHDGGAAAPAARRGPGRTDPGRSRKPTNPFSRYYAEILRAEA